MATCTHLTVSRTARYYEIGELEGTDVWLVLHGYGQLAADFVREFECIRAGRRIIAPEGLSRFYGPRGRDIGASWMTREDRLAEIRDYVDFLDTVVNHIGCQPSAVTVLGFSQGGHTACRWVARQSAVRRLVLWGSSLPDDLEVAGFRSALHGSDVYVVAGKDDRHVSDEDLERDVRRLTEMKLAARPIRFDGKHEIRADVVEKIATTRRGAGADRQSP